jgi:hypothetical protein
VGWDLRQQKILARRLASGLFLASSLVGSRDAGSSPASRNAAAKAAKSHHVCAVEPGYLERLSPASLLSLKLQGGPMSTPETEQFRQNPFAPAAVALRRWDDEAKIKGFWTPNLAHFQPHLASALALQTATVPFQLAAARRWPSGLKATRTKPGESPRKVRRSLPVVRSQSRTLRSQLAEASTRPPTGIWAKRTSG